MISLYVPCHYPLCILWAQSSQKLMFKAWCRIRFYICILVSKYFDSHCMTHFNSFWMYTVFVWFNKHISFCFIFRIVSSLLQKECTLVWWNSSCLKLSSCKFQLDSSSGSNPSYHPWPCGSLSWYLLQLYDSFIKLVTSVPKWPNERYEQFQYKQ